MCGMQHWETVDASITISLCPEGCLHLRIGRTITKLTQEEFAAFADLVHKADRGMRMPARVEIPR